MAVAGELTNRGAHERADLYFLRHTQAPAVLLEVVFVDAKEDCDKWRAHMEAIAEAVQRPTMGFVPLKTEDQLDLQALHRVRDRLIARRTALINQLRAFLLERGMTFRSGRALAVKPNAGTAH